ncbi:Thioredoxin superfamily protein [Rhynchospora pubera]|uniref:Thioredoxin superfamily protein n=1 Tax=Rhynchospora pubera TaxID=906938 RepID=A0AAV8C2J1_9POAL|nr:Thioredoxin superfamily protein [Rhynchospora pubera]KAJ4798796.1 Thioredoxin superfamily protein [Rhynchospora pubera]
MALYIHTPTICSTKYLTEKTHLKTSPLYLPILSFGPRRPSPSISSGCKFSLFKSRQNLPQINTSARASKVMDSVRGGAGNYEEESETDTDSGNDDDRESPLLTDQQTREEMRKKIREMIDQVQVPRVVETDDGKRKQKIEDLLRDYSLVVDEEDPDWPEENDDGWGFNLNEFFNKIQIKNNKRDDDDEGYDSAEDIVWKDDDYIVPLKEITAKEWEDTVFVDFNPLVILVHNRYRRPKENVKARNELVKAVEMIWQSRLPAPRCVGIDACREHKLVEALNISTYPEIIFTKAGKILHRDKVVRTAQEWTKMIGFFYYKAVRPSWLDQSAGQNQEKIPSLS